MGEWQFRKHYGPKMDGTEWSAWEDVFEGIAHYSPRTLLRFDPDASGRIEFRIKPEPTCLARNCDGAVDYDGLCAYHYDEANDTDHWPDFHDELPGMWDGSDLYGGWADQG